MAQARYSRLDNNRRQSSSYFSTVSVVVLVAICLVAVWMLTSSSSEAPGQNVDIPPQEQRNELNDEVESTAGRNVDILPQEQRNEMNDQVTESTDSNSKQFNDNPGNLPDDATQGDANGNTSSGEGDSNVQENQDAKPEEKPEENPDAKPEEKPEETTGEKPEENSQEMSNDGSNSETNNGENNAQDGDSKAVDGEKNSEDGGTKPNEDGSNESGQRNPEDSSTENKLDSEETEKKSDSSDTENKPDIDASQTNLNSDQSKQETEQGGQAEEKGNTESEQKTEQGGQAEEKGNTESEQSANGQANNPSSGDVFPSVTAAQTELLNETTAQSGSFSTQAVASKSEKETQKFSEQKNGFNWKACNVTAGPDFIPCLDNLKAIRSLETTKHYEHRERHCPEEPPTCLVPLPDGYRQSIEWPKSREKIWYYNVPHTKLAQYKGHQNWVKVTGEFLTFPGGGTQFKYGALHYIDFINESVPNIAWGKHSRVVLDVGCGVASFGGYLFDKDVLTMSLAPKDEHEAQVQFALERGIPAISSVMGTKRLPFPSMVFDVIHCARCRVPWHIDGGKLLLELNRVLRPGGFFVWSATPVYQKKAEDVEIWSAMTQLTQDMCWDLVSITKDKVDKVGIATYRKPTTNECYEKRSKQEPPMCEESGDANAAWNVPLQACIHMVPADSKERGTQWPEEWPARLEKTPYWLQSSQVGVYGKPAPEDFKADYEHWKRVVSNSYRNGMGINWSHVRNVMDMNAIYGGFAAALNDSNVWVMNVVSVNSADTLPIIYERGLFGIYHDWCESFSTYPRSYDLLHADRLFSTVKKRCDLLPVVAEVDRILRPGGKLIVREDAETLNVLEAYVRTMQWEVTMTYSKNNEGLVCIQKSMWRPKESVIVEYAIE